MSKNKELEIQMQFLEEATDYINTLEGVLLEIDTSHRIDAEKINGALRAAHSIKGGAGMMGFKVLSDLAHRLEDSFKVLKTSKKSLVIDTQLQNSLLAAVDWLRQIVTLLGEGNAIEEQWLATFCYPVFDELHSRLGDPTPEDAATILSTDEGQDIVPLLFETEVNECLERLESLLAAPDELDLQTEVATLAAELGGLGEMLQLTAFTQLCESIRLHIENATGDRIPQVAHLALKSWRRSQALVLTNQRDNLPTTLAIDDLATLSQPPEIQPVISPEPAELSDFDVPATELVTADLVYQNDNINHELAAVDFASINTLFAEETALETSSIEAKNEPAIVNKDREYQQENSVRIPTKQLEQINDLFGELIVQRNGVNSQLERLRKLVRNLNQRVRTLERENQELRTAYQQMSARNFISVSQSSTQNGEHPHSELHLRSQSVMETIVQVQEVSTDIQLSVDDTDQIARKLNKTSKQLQTKLNHIRMRPISDLVERFPRAIRDLNVEYGKMSSYKLKVAIPSSNAAF